MAQEARQLRRCTALGEEVQVGSGRGGSSAALALRMEAWGGSGRVGLGGSERQLADMDRGSFHCSA
jgi:hypothetical protein